MPQLDITWYPAQFFWMVITFTIMFLLISQVVVPRISKLLDERQHRIDEDLKRAEKLKAEVETITEAYEKVITEANTTAHDSLQKVRNEITLIAEQREKEMSDKLEKQIKAGEERVSQAKDNALKQVREISLETTSATVEKLSGIKVKDEELKDSVEKAIKEHLS